MFQQIWRDLGANKTDPSLREQAKFAGMQVAIAKQNKAFWSGEDEDVRMIMMMLVMMVMLIMKLTILFLQVKEVEAREPSVDMLDMIVTMFEHEGRSRRQVGNKLRELGLISSIKDITRKPLNARNMPWITEEMDKVR